MRQATSVAWCLPRQGSTGEELVIPSFPCSLFVLFLDEAIPLFYRGLGLESNQVGPVTWYMRNVQRTLLQDRFEKLDHSSVQPFGTSRVRTEVLAWTSDPSEHRWLRHLSSDETAQGFYNQFYT